MIQPQNTNRPRASIDWEAYLPLIKDGDIPEDQKRELIETLWWIMLAFVDLGFDLHPIQQGCGELPDLSPDLIRDVVNSKHSTTTQATIQGDAANGKAGEGSPT